jgi:flavin reductase (DIM6/NTAB) family NADH-FMN oxidoreductase RutF
MTAHTEAAPFDSRRLRTTLAELPTGVSVVTGIGAEGVPVGLAVGTFTSVSLEPPLVGFLPDKSSTSWPRIAPTGRFCVNVLAADQQQVCRTLATPAADKFAALRWRPAASGCPVLDGVLAWFDCEVVAIHDAGDHSFVVGRVCDLGVHPRADSGPLVFFRGGLGGYSVA